MTRVGMAWRGQAGGGGSFGEPFTEIDRGTRVLMLRVGSFLFFYSVFIFSGLTVS